VSLHLLVSLVLRAILGFLRIRGPKLAGRLRQQKERGDDALMPDREPSLEAQAGLARGAFLLRQERAVEERISSLNVDERR